MNEKYVYGTISHNQEEEEHVLRFVLAMLRDPNPPPHHHPHPHPPLYKFMIDSSKLNLIELILHLEG